MKIRIKETIHDFSGRTIKEGSIVQARFTGRFIFINGAVYPPLKEHQWEPVIDDEDLNKLLSS